MSDFTRDFDINTPIDHTKNNQWPIQTRYSKNDIAERLGDIISGFNSGETAKGVLALPFIAVTKPATITDQIQLYGKAVGGKTELHAVDEDGNEIQLTSAGAINLTAAAVNAFAYPVGSIYTSIVSTNPATLLGVGTWVAFASGRCLVGIDSTQTEFDAVEEAGGEKTHVLTIPEMPAHTHGLSTAPQSGQDTNCAFGPGSSIQTSPTGGGGAHNNLQPYITVYFWKRTA